MKPYAFLAMIVAITGFFATITAVESPKKSKNDKKTVHVLPLVEEMATANPLQF